MMFMMLLDDKLAARHLFLSFFLVGTSSCFGCQELTPLFEFGSEREMCSVTEPKGLQETWRFSVEAYFCTVGHGMFNAKGVIQKGMQIPMLVTVVDACLKTQ
ncbi:unnamed protein product [Sphagnum troendelagicum]|uniref:Secreted protein n=2 Tax=Sphagnum TaxID=13804 RepID=A0ABP0US48_9BRYO